MSYKQIKNEIKDILLYLIEFYRRPTKAIKKVPQWTWVSLIILISIFSVITGLLRGVFSANLLTGLVGMIFLPMSSYIGVFLTSSLLYFLVVIFQDRNLNFKRLTTLVFITLIPTLTMYVFSLIHPFVSLFGITTSFILMGTGLFKRFQLGKKFIYIVLGILYCLFLTSWLAQYLNMNSTNKKNEQLIEMNLQSQEILKKELSN